jgi:hypothetical protein
MELENKNQLEGQSKEMKQLSVEAEKLFDSAVESRLQMTYEERIEAHENARQLLVDLKRAGEVLRAKSQGTS